MPEKREPHREDHIDRFAGIAVVAGLVMGFYIVLRPFLSAILLAVILTYSTWPVYQRIERAVAGRKELAGVLMLLLITIVLVLPLALLAISLTDNITALIEIIRHLLAHGPPSPPEWVAKMPIIGSSVYDYWQVLAGSGATPTKELMDNLVSLRNWSLRGARSLAEGVLYLTLSMFISFFFYRDSAAFAGRLEVLLSRIAGERAPRLVTIAEATITSVIYGIIGTALAQGFLVGLGLYIAGVPGALLLGVLACIFSLIPFVGSSIIWGLAAIWLFLQGETGWAIFLVLWGLLLVSTIDNFLRPFFISKGSHLPYILVFLGALGGVMAFGFLGIFIGPALTAIVYALFQEWSTGKHDIKGEML